MKLLLTIVLIVLSTFVVDASDQETVNKKLVASRLSDLAETIANAEKHNVQEIIDQISNISRNAKDEISHKINSVKKEFGQLYETSNMKIKRMVQEKGGSSRLVTQHQHKIETILSDAEEGLKNCSEKMWNDAEKNQQTAEQHIKFADDYIQELHNVIASCNNSGQVNTQCVIEKSQDSKNKITLDLTLARSDVREFLDGLPDLSKEFHHCVMRTSHIAQNGIRRSERKVKHLLHTVQETTPNK